METKVCYAKLIAKEHDITGYITYVFEVLDNSFDKYVMCVRYPNWDHRSINIGEKGYLKFIEVIAGEDQYYHNKEFVPYNYDNWQFIKFVNKPTQIKDQILIDLYI